VVVVVVVALVRIPVVVVVVLVQLVIEHQQTKFRVDQVYPDRDIPVDGAVQAAVAVLVTAALD
jgi:hypothetical protein